MFTNYLGTGSVQWLVGTVAGSKRAAAYVIIRKDVICHWIYVLYVLCTKRLQVCPLTLTLVTVTVCLQ